MFRKAKNSKLTQPGESPRVGLKSFDQNACENRKLCLTTDFLGLERHEVTAVAVTPDGQRAVSASDDNTLKVWELESGELLATFTCDSFAGCCSYSDSIELFIAGDVDGRVHFLRLEEAKPKL